MFTIRFTKRVFLGECSLFLLNNGKANIGEIVTW